MLSSDRESCHGAAGADTVRRHMTGIGSRSSSLMDARHDLVIVFGPVIKIPSRDVECAPNPAVGLSIAADQSFHIPCLLVAALAAG